MSLFRSDHMVVAIQLVGSRSWDAQPVQVSIEKADLETSIRTISLKEFVCLVYNNVLELHRRSHTVGLVQVYCNSCMEPPI